HLYIKGWIFEELFKEETDCIKELSLVYVENEPVAVAVCWDYPPEYGIEGEQIGCYVKPDFRNGGIGTAAVSALGGVRGRDYRIGISDSKYFWSKLDEECLQD